MLTAIETSENGRRLREVQVLSYEAVSYSKDPKALVTALRGKYKGVHYYVYMKRLREFQYDEGRKS